MLQGPKHLTALLPVQSVARSIAFYEKLGFRTARSLTPPGDHEPAWAEIESDHARLMLARADEVPPPSSSLLFYLYFTDVQLAHAQATESGLEPGGFAYPSYCPKGEFRLVDPDGYVLMCSHT